MLGSAIPKKRTGAVGEKARPGLNSLSFNGVMHAGDSWHSDCEGSGIMKKLLLILALSASALLPTSAAFETARLPLPSELNPLNVLMAFVAFVLILTALADYSRAARTVLTARRNPAKLRRDRRDCGKSAHPLAA